MTGPDHVLKIYFRTVKYADRFIYESENVLFVKQRVLYEINVMYPGSI